MITSANVFQGPLQKHFSGTNETQQLEISADI